MTRRRVIFWNGDNKTYVSDEYNGDKAELEQFGSSDSCDKTWPEILELLNGVTTLVDDAIDCVPEACFCSECAQMGEPKSRRFDERVGKWRNTYHTFRKVGGEWPDSVWEYCGDCFYGETEMRGKQMQVVR